MNFNFIQPFTDFKQLYTYCSNAEKYVSTDYNISVGQARSATEYIIKFIYNANVGSLDGKTTYEMMTEQAFVDYINDDSYIDCLHYLRKMGNCAIHDGNINEQEAMDVLETLQYVVGEFFIMLELVDDYPVFENPNNIFEETPVAEVENEPVTPVEVEVEEKVLAKYGDKLTIIRELKKEIDIHSTIATNIIASAISPNIKNT